MDENKERDFKEKIFFTTERGKRFLMFFLVGTVGWGLNFLLLYLLDDYILGHTFIKNINYSLWIFTIDQSVIASLLSMVIVFILTFVVNKFWTFKGQGDEFNPSTILQFLQFTIIGLFGYAIYSGINMILDGSLNWNKYLAMTIAFYTGLISNFIWNDIWTFNPKLIEKRKNRRNQKNFD